MDLVHDVDLEAIARRPKRDAFLQATHFVDAVVACAVDLLHVDVVARRDFLACCTYLARRGRRPFGLTIGAGVFTFIPFTSFYVLLAWELLLANPWAGALLGAAYGLARSLPVITGAVVTGRGRLIAPVHIVILEASANIHRITAILLVILAVGLGIPFLLGH